MIWYKEKVGWSRTVVLSAIAVLVCAEMSFGGVYSVSYQVSAGIDDCYAWSGAEQDVSSSYLMIGNGAYSVPYQMAGMRFVGVGVPRSASIVSANLRIYTGADENRGQIYGAIEGEAVDDAADFGGRYIGSSVRTSAAVSWDHKFAWDDGVWLSSPDVSGVVQDVVGRGGWSLGNSLAMFYSTRADSGKSRAFASYELGSSYAAVLNVSYEVFRISGYVMANGGVGLSGVAVSAGAAIEGAATDQNGYYELQVPPGWLGTVTMSKVGWSFVDESIDYINVISDQTDQDYTGQPTARVFVDITATGNGDGSSWSNAYNYLQDALHVTYGNPAEIFVAQGIYRPDQNSVDPNGNGDQLASFFVSDGLYLYGGFPSGGGDWAERDPEAYRTTLSGDLGSNDGSNFSNYEENSFNVVVGDGQDANALIEGFTIEGGNAIGSYDLSRGGGIGNFNGTIKACRVVGNVAMGGGDGRGRNLDVYGKNS